MSRMKRRLFRAPRLALGSLAVAIAAATFVKVFPLAAVVVALFHRAEFAGKHPDVKFEAFAVRFGNRLGYSGDIGDPSDLAPLFPLDLLVCELAHFHPQKLADFLKDKPVKRLALTHLSRQARARLPEVKALFPNATVANDGDSIEC
jgi:ribonuclease BN (tRNA processing enzyme)